MTQPIGGRGHARRPSSVQKAVEGAEEGQPIVLTGYPYTDEGGRLHFGFRVGLDKRPAEVVADMSRLLSRPDVSARILAVPGTELLATRYLNLPFWKWHLTVPVDQRRSEMAARSLDLIYAVLPARGTF